MADNFNQQAWLESLKGYNPTESGTAGLPSYDDYVTPSAGAEAGAGVMDKLGGVANIVGGVGQGVGAIANIYGTYQQAKQAEKNYELAKKAWDAQMARAERQDKTADEQRLLQNMMTNAQYANDVVGEAGQSYGTYQQGMY